jgi:predicted ATP-dependent endonuclease of OLD family
MKLLKATIHKYKCIEITQSFGIEDDITVLVGMNESGKTSILEALAKTNYFTPDKKFKFATTHDYPRKEKKTIDKSGEDPGAVTCIYEIPDDLIGKIAKDVGPDVFAQKTVEITTKFSNKETYSGVVASMQKFIEFKTSALGISSKTLNDKLANIKNSNDLDNLVKEYQEEQYTKGLASLKPYFENKWKWANPIEEYIVRVHLEANRPKYLYYDEYYTLPSRISIEQLQKEELDSEEMKTAKALFELADINIQELLEADNYEDFKAELEATQATITEELFKYWTNNKNLEIEFNIDKVEKAEEKILRNPYNSAQEKVEEVKIVEHVLDIRVKNNRSKVSLPLKNRSKGFNWFFSFLVWFKKIQENKNNNYILLLDEPGLNLHATAQESLLRFLNDLAKDYQIIYTTHSPFMIESDKLPKVRTVVETANGSVVSDSVQEKDPNTLFPLQAALGYDIAQNLFISKHNLLIEGASDLLYLQIMSALLGSVGRTALEEKITLVPVGGMDKVVTFISLLRGNKLSVVCLLDTVKDPKSKARLSDLIDQKIIHQNKIKFFDEFVQGFTQADLEDLFKKEDYLKFYNEAYPDAKVNLSDLNPSIQPILIQICKFLGIERFNHYRPANTLASKGIDANFFSKETLDNFELLFKSINKLFN